MPADAPPVRMPRVSSGFAAACLVAVVLTVLLTRWLGPHDLYEKDQPKTLAYTADVVLHGRFSLPRDVIYQPATKPPLYNWVAAAAVAATGSWDEWSMKLPSTIGVLATGAIVFAMARRSTAGAASSAPQAAVVGLLAAGVWFTFGSDVRHGSVLRLSYLARPDMLLTALCTGAWAAFTVAVERPSTRAAFVPAALAWSCVTAAALTKGPAAVLPAAYGVLYAVVLGSNRQAIDEPNRVVTRRVWAALAGLSRLWLPVGVPVVVLGVGGWLYAAGRQDAEHVRQVIWGAEVAGRLTETPEGFRKPIHYAAMWFVTKAQPWGAIAVFGLLMTAWLPRLRPAGGAAALYLGVVLLGLSVPAAKRMDYLLPAYAPAAVLVAVLLADVVRGRVLGVFAVVGLCLWVGVRVAEGGGSRTADWLVPGVIAAAAVACLGVEHRRALPLATLAVVPVVLAVSMGHAFRTKFFEARQHWSDHAVAFVADVRRQVGDDRAMLVLVRGKHPLLTLLGRHQGSFLTPADLKAATFVVLPEQADLSAVVMSEALPEGFAELEHRPLVRLGLYRAVPTDRLIAAQKACGEWTAVENPYHAIGTVYRDD